MPAPVTLARRSSVEDDCTRCSSSDRAWVTWAVRTVEADANRSADTHLIPVHLPAEWGIELYLKDESTHPTGSLKHRLARSLFLYGLCNGWIHERSTIVEASSGSTAVSEAYFARLLGLRFVAVMPRATSCRKIELIERHGGQCEFVDEPSAMYAVAQDIADRSGGHYIDQFTYAERATDWRGNNNIAESIFEQMTMEPHPEPSWVVVGAGTGGTSATIGRYVRYQGLPTRLCVVDPERSAFFEGWRGGDPQLAGGTASRIEGIGRPRVEPSFQAGVVDRMMRVPDAGSIAAIRLLRERTGLLAGGSTGTNVYGALRLLCEMRETGEPGSIVTLLCDSGERYAETYYDDGWLRGAGLDPTPHEKTLRRALGEGIWTGPDNRGSTGAVKLSRPGMEMS